MITDRVLDLFKGEADLAIRVVIREGEPKDEALVRRKIADVSWSVYASRGYLERYGRPAEPDSLKGHLVIGFDGPINLSWRMSPIRSTRAVAPGFSG